MELSSTAPLKYQSVMQSKLSLLEGKRYQPKIKLEFSRKNYTVKTASTASDYREAFRLRFDVFYGEKIGVAKPLTQGFDCDFFDNLADLLVLQDNDTGETVGTYRLLSSQNSSQFYSQTEFDLSLFLLEHKNVLEMSRACIHPQYRNGITLSLLWMGVMEYARLSGAEFLFGCSSIWTSDTEVVASLLTHLKNEEFHSERYQIAPLNRYHAILNERPADAILCKDFLPPLLSFYLRAGAKVYGEPAYDHEFGCFDLLTILDVGNIQDKYRRRYC